VPCDITLEVESDGRVFHAQTLDISHGGLFFALDPPFDKGTRLRMRFELPNEQEISGSATDGGEDHTPPPIQAEGQVAWVGSSPEGTAGMGVRFSRIDPGDLERIVDYVNRLAGVLYAP
jgi:c-di-GMP-binding flagellar brake protein YcgR